MRSTVSLGLAILALGSLAILRATASPAPAPKASRVFELRTYTALPGRAEALHTRFRDHTCAIFQKHGMELIGFWTPRAEADKDKLIYVLAYPSKEAADASWKAFGADPEWKKARDESEKDGKIVAKFESVYMDPTDYSPAR